MTDATEIACEQTGQHQEHSGTLRDYAWPGSATVVHWYEDDRRNFHEEWPGPCPDGLCVLPAGHPGSDAA